MLVTRLRALLCMMLLSLAPDGLGADVRSARAGSFDTDAGRIALLRQRVRYIFVIYQENRSFDSYFGTFPRAEGLFSHPAQRQAGFAQPIVDLDGTVERIGPFRIGPAQYAADTDDVDHAHSRILAKMNVVAGSPRMDRFALTEERKYSPSGKPTLMAKQFG